jgi:ligand-binding sensor domain-containing protein/signal transduction histidine kinase
MRHRFQFTSQHSPGTRTAANQHARDRHIERSALAFRMVLPLLLFLVGCIDSVAAANPLPRPSSGSYIIDSWDTDDGLPQNSVTAITQTRDGYLWFGTLNGLVRFDGLRFTVFDENNTPELSSSRIVTLFEDRQDNLWIGTETGGIAKLQQGRITTTGIGQYAFESRLVAACQGIDGAVWLYTADGQLWRHHNDRFASFLFAADSPSPARSLIAEPSGTVWIGTRTRLAALGSALTTGLLEMPVEQEIPVQQLDQLLASQDEGHWRLADGRVQKWIGDSLDRDYGPYPWGDVTVAAACEDQDGNLVVGTRGQGLFWFDPDGAVTVLSSRDGLSHDLVLSLAMDREGNIWVGTQGGGLNRVKRQLFQVLDASQGHMVQSVTEDAAGAVWIGYHDRGIARQHGTSTRFYGPDQGLGQPQIGSVHVDFKQAAVGLDIVLAHSQIGSVYADREQRVWAGTLGAGLFQLQQDRFQRVPRTDDLHPTIFAIHQDRVGEIWIGTEGGLGRLQNQTWTMYTTQNGLSADVIRALADDPEGTLWIGTVGGGLNRLVDGQFSSLHKQDGLPSEEISSLHVDSQGVLWIGTFGSGLARFHGGQWTHYTMRHGLVSNSIGSIIEDHEQQLWIGSIAGLMRVSLSALNQFARGENSFVSCRVYGRPDGLPTSECTIGSQPGAWRSRDGRLWFATVKGLASVHPDQLQVNPHPPPVRIESVLIDGVPVEANPLVANMTKSVTLPHHRERLEIQFTSLNLGAPEKARFHYRLEGHESDWIESGSTRFARYSRLPAGRYQFHVKAANEDDVWNETGSSIAVIVLRPYWRTWWFMSSSVLLLFGVVAAVVHYLSTQRLQRQLTHLRHAEALDRERSRIAADLHDQLGASLTQVALLGELVETDKTCPEEVESHARQISQTARDTTRVLDEIVWAVNPSNDTLESLVSYASKHAQEYLTVANLRLRLDLPDTLPPALLLPEVRHNVYLAFKEAITNVVRHAGAQSVQIRLQLLPGAFLIEIEDDGRGLAHLDPVAAQARNGLRNMRNRLANVGGSCTIDPGTRGGTLVRITAPFVSPEHPAQPINTAS